MTTKTKFKLNYGSLGFMFRYAIHTFMKFVNRVSGYRIWQKQLVPKVYRGKF